MFNNNYNINKPKSKLDNSYLIVGIDVGKTNQYARITDYEGNELCKKIIFQRNITGLNTLLLRINTLKIDCKKQNVFVVMEPTGIYWENIYKGLKSLDSSIQVALVDVRDVISVRSLFFKNVKSDTVDSLAIAKTAILKGFRQRLELTEKEESIKHLTTTREEFVKKSVGLKNLITNILDQVFPEYKQVYRDYFCKGSLVLLSTVCFPNDINKLSEAEIYAEAKKISRTCVGKKTIEKLKLVAKQSIGTGDTLGKRFQFNANLDILKKYLNYIDEIEKLIDKEMADNEMYNNMMEIKGINTVSAANLLSEIGNFNKFNHPKQLISYCGLNLKINESGNKKGKTSISKNGNSRMRAYLFRVLLPILRFNHEFAKLHEHFTKRKDNPLKPMQSLIALACKLLRIFYGMAKNNSKYEKDKCFKNIFANVA